MKTRKELIAEVDELGRDLGEEVSTERLNNAALAELAASLRARLEDRTSPAAPPVTGVGAQRVQPTPSPSKEHAPPAPAIPGQGQEATGRHEDKPHPPPPLVADPAPKAQGVDGAAAPQGGPPPPMAEQAKAPSAPYYVAPGRSVAANGRVLGPYKPVKASDFPGGQTDLDYFVLKGAVVRS